MLWALLACATAVCEVDLDQDGVDRKSIQSFDPSRSMAQIDFQNAEAELLGTDGGGAELISHVLDRAAILMAFEQLGTAQACFDATKALWTVSAKGCAGP